MLTAEIASKEVNNKPLNNARVKLSKVHVLLAEKDPCLAHVMICNLRAMGFTRITYAKNSTETRRALHNNEIHVIVTERQLGDSDGLDVVRALRAGNHPQRREIPIILASGRAEEKDVLEARDAGINEYLVKPFSSLMLFKRIEQIVDKPRSFIVSKHYVGPDRRRTGAAPEGISDRRSVAPTIRSEVTSPLPAEDMPIMVPAHHMSQQSLIRKVMGSNEPLASIITPELVAEAQAAINALRDTYMDWLATDLSLLSISHTALKEHFSAHHLVRAKNAALSLKERAGIFGLTLGSHVAANLYQFLDVHYKPQHSKHHIITDKHIDALTIAIGHPKKDDPTLGRELVRELKRLVISQT